MELAGFLQLQGSKGLLPSAKRFFIVDVPARMIVYAKTEELARSTGSRKVLLSMLKIKSVACKGQAIVIVTIAKSKKTTYKMYAGSEDDAAFWVNSIEDSLVVIQKQEASSIIDRQAANTEKRASKKGKSRRKSSKKQNGGKNRKQVESMELQRQVSNVSSTYDVSVDYTFSDTEGDSTTCLDDDDDMTGKGHDDAGGDQDDGGQGEPDTRDHDEPDTRDHDEPDTRDHDDEPDTLDQDAPVEPTAHAEATSHTTPQDVPRRYSVDLTWFKFLGGKAASLRVSLGSSPDEVPTTAPSDTVAPDAEEAVADNSDQDEDKPRATPAERVAQRKGKAAQTEREKMIEANMKKKKDNGGDKVYGLYGKEIPEAITRPFLPMPGSPTPEEQAPKSGTTAPAKAKKKTRFRMFKFGRKKKKEAAAKVPADTVHVAAGPGDESGSRALSDEEKKEQLKDRMAKLATNAGGGQYMTGMATVKFGEEIKNSKLAKEMATRKEKYYKEMEAKDVGEDAAAAVEEKAPKKAKGGLLKGKWKKKGSKGGGDGPREGVKADADDVVEVSEEKAGPAEVGEDMADGADKKGAADRASKKDRASKRDTVDRTSKKDRASKKDPTDRSSKKDRLSKKDRASKKDIADRTSKKDIADRTSKKDNTDRTSKKDNTNRTSRKDRVSKSSSVLASKQLASVEAAEDTPEQSESTSTPAEQPEATPHNADHRPPVKSHRASNASTTRASQRRGSKHKSRKPSASKKQVRRSERESAKHRVEEDADASVQPEKEPRV